MSRAKATPPDRSITGLRATPATGAATAPPLTAGSDFLHLDIADAPAGGRAAWLADQLRAAIADGRITAGGRLPATRVLAGDLGVSRGVVTEAYQRLVEEGRVAGRGRAGTVVVAAPPAPPRPQVAPAPATLFPTSPGSDIFDAVRTAPARIDLTPGVPDLAAFPRAEWLRAERTVLRHLAAADFGYGDPRGAPALRRAVAAWLARNRGIAVDPADVLVTAGVSQALGLLAQALRTDGIDRIAVEEPGSLGVRQHLNNWGMDTPPVTVDAAGLRVDELAVGGAGAVMLTPAHQFPTGVVLDGDRRRQLVGWARAGGLVVEDDYDAEHRYDRPPVPALRALLPDHVCYAGSVSKLLAPALRVGWLLVPNRYRDAVVAAKRNADLGNSVLPQLVLAELMTSGALERQLRLLRRRHVRRRDAMVAAVSSDLPGATVHGAAAGLHLMVTLPGDVPDTEVAAAALARGVKVQPLSWHCQRPHRPGLVLGYAANTATDIEEGVATIGAVLRRGCMSDRGPGVAAAP
ncbi:PLP-dependent aminotransferase family protein [Micromonospora sp. WMMD812]|uniref:MocR-like pyridoxine biosynthesis transcription factor PdxR n=1 Tax=Micromonospora sp. WMMD812 TaxID=3015152 RepID=UPI00248CD8BC|nr:PLP-dependent aminotransferase family protein [Micromonospora sp. WMMD812]WBB68616.1 PLP-dependent aminotransferase family protein [Micromonospora sp. WMMD812]